MPTSEADLTLCDKNENHAVTQSFREVQPRSKTSFYKPELDVLRFLAFLGVFVVHIMHHWTIAAIVARHVPYWVAKIILGCFHAGAYGVDLFFVLSGYLITELLIRERAMTGSLNVRAFYVRRILRIWPIYYLVVAAAALVPFLNLHHQFGVRYVLPFLCMAGNWSFVWFGWPNSVAVPLWSVSVEEQFYLLWPPIVARLSLSQIKITALGLIVVANITRLVALMMRESTQKLWGNTLAHLDSIAAGILLAVLLGGEVVRCRYSGRLTLLSVGILCLVARGYFVAIEGDEQLSLLGTLIGYPAVVFACTAIIVAFMGLPFRLPTLEYLGKISYGLYIYHLLSIHITDGLMPEGGVMYDSIKFVLAFGITVAISATSYAVVEKPFLNLKHRFTYVESRRA